MAQEMGLDPRSLIKNIPSPTQQWKAPVKEWVRDMYERRQEKAARKRRRRAKAEAAPKPAPEASEPPPAQHPAGPEGSQTPSEFGDPAAPVDGPFAGDPSPPAEAASAPEEELWDPLDETERRVRREAADEDRWNRERHRHFGEVAACIAAAMAEIPNVQRVVLFGSAARPLTWSVPRWRKYRRYGLEIAYHCDDVDLAVWVDDLTCLPALQRARNVTVNEYLHATNFGVAQHQVDVFMMEPGTDRYLGRLCIFRDCPKSDKEECRVPGCGHPPHLRQHESFTLKPDALAPERSRVLFERSGPAEPDNS
jgi:hypothetical protein